MERYRSNDRTVIKQFKLEKMLRALFSQLRILLPILSKTIKTWSIVIKLFYSEFNILSNISGILCRDNSNKAI